MKKKKKKLLYLAILSVAFLAGMQLNDTVDTFEEHLAANIVDTASDVKLDIKAPNVDTTPQHGYGNWNWFRKLYFNKPYIIAHNFGSGTNFLKLHKGDKIKVNGVKYKITGMKKMYGPKKTYPLAPKGLGWHEYKTNKDIYSWWVNTGDITLQTCIRDQKGVYIYKGAKIKSPVKYVYYVKGKRVYYATKPKTKKKVTKVTLRWATTNHFTKAKC